MRSEATSADVPGVADVAPSPVVAAPGVAVDPKLPGSHRDIGNAEIEQRAKWWLAGIAATLLLLLVMGRRKRRPQRVRKMSSSTVEPVAPHSSTPALRLRPTEKPQVRMFAAREIYAPTHESHRAPWEAPVTTDGGFEHCFEIDDKIADGLLFVPEPESHGVEPLAMPAVEARTYDPPADARAEQEPRVLSASGIVDQPTSNAGAAFPAEAAIAAIGAIAAVERNAPADAPAELEAAHTQVAGGHPTPKVAIAQESTQHTGASTLDAAELGLSPGVPRSFAADDATSSLAAEGATASQPAAPQGDLIADARKLIEAGEYASALACLDEATSSSQPRFEVWMMSALCWWRMARADGGSKAYANAASAMERLLERDDSQADIWYRAGTCRLLQASGEGGAAQRATLDLAVAALRRAAQEGGQADPLRLSTLGDALFERALAATDETIASRAKRMAEAVNVLREVARTTRDPASTASWKLQEALQAQANLLSSIDASKVRQEADAVLAAGAHGAAEDERLAWYAAKVENELAHAELAQGATRTLHLRTFRENYRDVLTGPDAAPQLLLCWLELLALETGHLRGDAARARFDEGEVILRRLDALLPGNAHVALARARLLRRRAAHSSVVSRPAPLADAIAALMPFVERGDAPQLQIEMAELMLDRAACVPSAQTVAEHARAEAMASGLLGSPEFAMAAARCVLQARLGQSQGAVEPEVCRRLEVMAGNDVRSRWLLARAALRNGAPREACGHCEAAARSGARLDQALVQLWDQASRQWGTTLHGQKDAAWLSNRQSLRSVS